MRDNGATDDTVAAVALLLSKHGISAVPVCDNQGRLLGVISEGDLMRPLGEVHALRRAWWACSKALSSRRNFSTTSASTGGARAT